MKRNHWIFLFAVALAANIVAALVQNMILGYISKPLIILSLAGCFTASTSKDRHKLKSWIYGALLFSWIGDILLMFQETEADFFLLGVIAFLLAHIFYIIFFHRVRIRENLKNRFLFLLLVVAYYAGLIIWLSPYLGEMKVPVRIYGIVISFMLLLALHTLYCNNKMAGKWMTTGAILFVISDSLLAINKFYLPIEFSSLYIMLMYGLAQLFLVKGAALYITSINKN